MAAPETFDPKRYTPFEVGVPVGEDPLHVPGHRHGRRQHQDLAGAGARRQGDGPRHADPLARVADLGNILHSRHQYHWHTGYVPPQTVACPHLGSWIARVRGPNNPAIPPFINIGQRLEGVGESEELKAFTTGGFFGSEFGPFNLPFPTDAVDAVRPPKGMTARALRGAAANASANCCGSSPVGELASDYHQESMLRALDNAHRLLSSQRARRLRPDAGAEGESTTGTTPAASASAACSPAGWPRPGRASSK